MAVRLVSKALRGGRTLPISTNSFSNFNENLLNCVLDYKKLTQRIVSQKEKRFSLCLYGPPGTGKSAYARYLADQVGMDVVFKRASDLVDKYVGETEKNIADAMRISLPL